ncbi:hypothetical protein E2562_021540 [Oryza meyeriana var. granulata]|uniref:Pentacotripeptide-repeat region of PRORP domain-containing protein n=1 Tax=Oryza meyeriana var. granulata TaxID=110450 RepID=A0A6G1EXV5_9ORYZ|nr:hypothetical protein E2562_021540 [Oryza meyeriana var. granulata]
MLPLLLPPSPSSPPPPRAFSPRCSLQATPPHAGHLLDGEARRHAAPAAGRGSAVVYAREIGACVRARRWAAACEAFAAMRAAGAAPDRFLLPQVLCACAGAGEARLAAAAHALAAKGGPAFAADAVVGNALVAMYAELGDVSAARAAFASLPERDVVAWTALVGAYADAGELGEAFELFKSMQESGVRPDVISWNTLVSGFARNGDLRAALHLFDDMRLRGVKPVWERSAWLHQEELARWLPNCTCKCIDRGNWKLGALAKITNGEGASLVGINRKKRVRPVMLFI